MDSKTLILAIVLSAVILILFEFVLPTAFPHYFGWLGGGSTQTNPPAPTTSGTTTTGGQTTTAGQPAVPPAPATSAFKPRAAALADSPRIEVRSERLLGTISLVGGRLDDLTLANYRETIDPASPHIVLLKPPGAANAYYSGF